MASRSRARLRRPPQRVVPPDHPGPGRRADPGRSVHVAGFDQSPAQLRGLGRRGQRFGGVQQGASVAANIGVLRAVRGRAGEQARCQEQGAGLMRVGGRRRERRPGRRPSGPGRGRRCAGPEAATPRPAAPRRWRPAPASAPGGRPTSRAAVHHTRSVPTAVRSSRLIEVTEARHPRSRRRTRRRPGRRPTGASRPWGRRAGRHGRSAARAPHGKPRCRTVPRAGCQELAAVQGGEQQRIEVAFVQPRGSRRGPAGDERVQLAVVGGGAGGAGEHRSRRRLPRRCRGRPGRRRAGPGRRRAFRRPGGPVRRRNRAGSPARTAGWDSSRPAGSSSSSPTARPPAVLVAGAASPTGEAAGQVRGEAGGVQRFRTADRSPPRLAPVRHTKLSRPTTPGRRGRPRRGRAGQRERARRGQWRERRTRPRPGRRGRPRDGARR